MRLKTDYTKVTEIKDLTFEQIKPRKSSRDYNKRNQEAALKERHKQIAKEVLGAIR